MSPGRPDEGSDCCPRGGEAQAMSGAARIDARIAAFAAAGRQRAEPRPSLGVIAPELAAQEPDRVVLRDGEWTMTRGEMVDMASRLGGALQARGLRKGSVVAFQLPNWWEACVINMAAALFGWRIVPLLPIYRRAELGQILPAAGVEALFLPPADDRINYHALIEDLPGAPPLVFPVRGDGEGFEELIRADPASPDPAESHDAKMIIFTSGSTGRPKGVIHSHASMDAVVRRTGAFWGLGERDVLYVPSPIGHIGGSIYAFEFPWITGCATILEDRWDPDRAVSRIDGTLSCVTVLTLPRPEARRRRANPRYSSKLKITIWVPVGAKCATAP